MTKQSTQLPPGTCNALNLHAVSKVAEWARVNPKTIYRWIKENKHNAIQYDLRICRAPEDAISRFMSKTGYSKVSDLLKQNGRNKP